MDGKDYYKLYFRFVGRILI
jgi:hypothetical protein